MTRSPLFLHGLLGRFGRSLLTWYLAASIMLIVAWIAAALLLTPNLTPGVVLLTVGFALLLGLGPLGIVVAVVVLEGVVLDTAVTILKIAREDLAAEFGEGAG